MDESSASLCHDWPWYHPGLSPYTAAHHSVLLALPVRLFAQVPCPWLIDAWAICRVENAVELRMTGLAENLDPSLRNDLLDTQLLACQGSLSPRQVCRPAVIMKWTTTRL